VTDSSVYLSRFSTAVRVTLGDAPTLQVLSQVATLIGAHDDGLVALLNASWIGVGTPDADGKITYIGVAGGTPGTHYTLHGEHVYWYRNSSGRSRQAEVILRGRLDGLGEQEVVAEAWDQIAFENDVPSFAVGAQGIGWWPSSMGGFHHHPFPLPAAPPVVP
jgi:hypothetical protein